MSERHHLATGWPLSQGLLFAILLVIPLMYLSGCGPEQTDIGQTNRNSVPVNLNVSMPQESAAAASTSGSRFWATVQSWLPSLSNAWAQGVTPQLVALTVEVTGPGLDPPITKRQELSDPQSGQTVALNLDVPVGSDRVFTVSGLNGAGRAILRGQSTRTTLTVGQPATVDITLVGITITITTSSLPSGTVTAAYSEPVQGTGGTGALTWTISAGALPPGLTINASTGVISGIPSTAGTFNFTVRATDTSSLFDTQPLSITITLAPIPPTITTTTLPGGTVNTAYSQPVRATGGTGALTWTISAGALPPPLTLNASTGVISGTPSTMGTFNFTVRATDTLSLFDTQSLSMTVALPAPPRITTTTLPNGTVRTAYNQSLQATGGTGARTWSLSSGSLPTNLSLSPAGVISGTPTNTGPANFTVRVTDALSQSDNQTLSITVVAAPPALTITTTSLPNGTVRTAYNQSLQASGGTGTRTWSLFSGSLPTNLSLSPAGVISGTPTNTGTANFTVRVTDALSQADTQALSITIGAALVITTTSLPGGMVDTDYSQQVRATGGTGALTWTISAGALPPPLTLNPTTGVISGTPSTAGTFTFTVRATDTLSLFDTQALSIIVTIPLELRITTGKLPPGTVDQDYSAPLNASGGIQPYSWSVVPFSSEDPIPAPGLSLSLTGQITGTPDAAGTFTKTYRVRDSIGASVTRDLTLDVFDLEITRTELPGGCVDSPYSDSPSAVVTVELSVSGGTLPYTWSIVGNFSPAPGLSLSSSGQITGTPDTAGTFTRTYRVEDRIGITSTRDLTIDISNCSLS